MNDTRYHIKNVYGDRFEPYECLEDALRDWRADASDLIAIFQCGRMVAFKKRRDWHPEEFCGADDNLFVGWNRKTLFRRGIERNRALLPRFSQRTYFAAKIYGCSPSRLDQ